MRRAAAGAGQQPVPRRSWLALVAAQAAMAASGVAGASAGTGPTVPAFPIDAALRVAWLERWQRNILAAARNRYCDTAMGEEIGWLISPLLEGFYYGYLATGDAAWIERLTDWTARWLRRGVVEPDGYVGWPKVGAAGTDVDNLDSFYADSLLGEAMALRPVVLAAAEILRTPTLKKRFGEAARDYILVARRTFEKWDRRGVWRVAGDGMISVVLPYGIDRATGRWTEGERDKDNPRVGFSHPDNKANQVALWLLAMADATGEATYRARAAAWFRLMKARLYPKADGTYRIWNYWEPAGPWDYRAPGVPKHWVGVHPNPGYYEIDVNAIAAAWRHGLVFAASDIDRLIRTAVATGRMWPALGPFDARVRVRLERTLNPDSWAGLSLVPWCLAQQRAAPTGP